MNNLHADVRLLQALLVAPREDRVRMLLTAPQAELARMLAMLIDLSDSVEKNSREAVAMIMICEAKIHPHSADNVNLPTLLGALNGILLAAQVDQAGTCAGCAYRLGSVANQCLSTTMDADYMGRQREGDFYCHEKLDDSGNPVKLCVGHAKVAKACRAEGVEA